MLGALIYLRVTSFRNWLLWRLRRLKQPKYLFGAIVGVAYFYFFFFRRVGSRHGHNPISAVAAAPLEWMPVIFATGTVVLLVIMALLWVVPTERAALGFSEAEIAFLFPAPVTRRSLVHFRLVSSQLRTLSASLIMALISNRWTFLGGNALTHALGWWFVFSALSLHFTAAKFTMTRLADRGVGVFWRRLLVLVAVVVVVGIALWRLPEGARLPTLDGNGGFSDWITNLAGTAPMYWLLFPLRLVLAPFFAPDVVSFFKAAVPGLIVLGVHYIWVVQTVTTFEESSIALAEKRSARIAAWRAGEGLRRSLPQAGRPAPFPLASVGRPELAFLWKNLLSTWPYFNLRVFGVCVAIIVAGSVWINTHANFRAIGEGTGIVALFAGAYLLLLGPQFARQDIRSDLRKIDILKTYPLAGWQIVLGELLTPTVILTALIWLCLLTSALNIVPRHNLLWLTPGIRVATGIGLMLIVPPVVMLQLLVPNTAALIFPSWFEATRTRGGGPEVMGQRMIFLFAQLLTVILVLIPAAIVGAIVIWLASHVASMPISILAGVLPVVVVLFGEVILWGWRLGGRFEAIDVAEELRS